MEKQPINSVYVVTVETLYIENNYHMVKVDSVWYREDEAKEYCETLNNYPNTEGIYEMWEYEEITIQ